MNSGGYEALLYFLQYRDISDFDPRCRPITGHGQDVREVSMNSAQRFWFEALQAGQVPVWDYDFSNNEGVQYVQHNEDGWQSVPKDKVYKAYVEQCRDKRERITVIEQVFWDSLYKMLGTTSKEDRSTFDAGRRTIGGTRHRCIRLPPIESLRRMYDAANQVSTEWEEIDRSDASPDAGSPYEDW
jgi:hypothetical protein